LDILSFFGSVWLAIFAGVFFIAMVVGCTFDRRQSEEGKWFVFGIGVVIAAIIGWLNGYQLSFDSFLSAWRTILTYVGIYLAIGLGYSVIEFMLDVRRSARFWTEKWANFLRTGSSNYSSKSREQFATMSNEEKANSFVASNSGQRRIITIGMNEASTSDKDLIIPKVDRKELAEGIGCWAIFWPFYAVSLIIGDLLMEVWRTFANAIVYFSGRFVRMVFSDVFKFDNVK
jgi:hypothetical protein